MEGNGWKTALEARTKISSVLVPERMEGRVEEGSVTRLNLEDDRTK